MACATVGHMDGNPCPNPTCTYIFPSAAVVGAASLTCPRCGGVFRFRHSPPDAGKAPARPAPGDGPSRSPLFSESSDDVSAHDSGPGLPEDLLSLPGPRRRMPQRSRRGAWLAALIVLVLCSAVGLAIWLYRSKWSIAVSYFGSGDPADTSKTHESTQFNYRFTLPAELWRTDDETRIAVKANLLAMRRSDPDGWLALAAQDYKRRTPGDSEVIEEAVRRLRNHFKQSLEYESAGNDELADRPAQRIVFQGAADNARIRRECYMLEDGGMF